MEPLTAVFYVVKVLDLVVVSLLFAVVLRRYLRYRLKIMFSLLLLLVFYFLNRLTGLLFTFEAYQNQEMGLISILCGSLMFGFLGDFFGRFASSNQQRHGAIIIGSVSGVSAIILSDIIQGTSNTFYETEAFGLKILNWSIPVTIILMLLYLYIAIFVFYDFQRSDQNFPFQEHQLTNFRRMKAGFVLAIHVGFITSSAGSVLLNIQEEVANFVLQILTPVTVSVGFLILIRGYINASIGFYRPQMVDALIVIDSSGIPIYKFSFRQEQSEDVLTLASGAISAISAIMKEAFGSKSDIQSIQLADKQLVIEFIDQLAFVLVTSAVTSFQRDALKKFASSYPKPEMEGVIADHTELDEDILRIFGYR